MRRPLAAVVLLGMMLGACTKGAAPEEASHRVIVFDREEPSRESHTSKVVWLSVDPGTGTTSTLFEADGCAGCVRPILASDGRSLWTVTDEKVGERKVENPAGSLPVWANRLVRVDGLTGKVEEGPVFAQGVLGGGWAPTGISPDGKYVYFNIPHNPAHAEDHPLHAAEGIARYNVAEGTLEEKPLSSARGWEVHTSADGRSLYVCCWVQHISHPVPGFEVVDALTGEIQGEVTLGATDSAAVHPTRLVAAPDGRHFYALQAGTDLAWTLDAETKKIKQTTIGKSLGEHILAELFPVAYAKMGHYEDAAGSMVVSPDGKTLYSSLYLVEAYMSGPSGPKHLEGGGITFLRTSDFKRLAHIEPDVTYEDVAISPDGQYLYALDTEGRALWIIDTATRKVQRKVENLGRFPGRLVVVKGQ